MTLVPKPNQILLIPKLKQQGLIVRIKSKSEIKVYTDAQLKFKSHGLILLV